MSNEAPKHDKGYCGLTSPHSRARFIAAEEICKKYESVLPAWTMLFRWVIKHQPVIEISDSLAIALSNEAAYGLTATKEKAALKEFEEAAIDITTKERPGTDKEPWTIYGVLTHPLPRRPLLYDSSEYDWSFLQPKSPVSK